MQGNNISNGQKNTRGGFQASPQGYQTPDVKKLKQGIGAVAKMGCREIVQQLAAKFPGFSPSSEQ